MQQTSTNLPVRVEGNGTGSLDRLPPAPQYTPEQMEILTSQIARGAKPEELRLFLAVCQRTGLDPFLHQIWGYRRGKDSGDPFVIHIGIDGLRLLAERSGLYGGADGPYWCGKDGIWLEFWDENAPPTAAQYLVYRKGCSRPFKGIATFRGCAQQSPKWKANPAEMLAKCAEAMALRRAFPYETAAVNSPRVQVDEETGEVIDAPAAPRQPHPRVQAAVTHALETQPSYPQATGLPRPAPPASKPTPAPSPAPASNGNGGQAKAAYDRILHLLKKEAGLDADDGFLVRRIVSELAGRGVGDPLELAAPDLVKIGTALARNIPRAQEIAAALAAERGKSAPPVEDEPPAGDADAPPDAIDGEFTMETPA